MENKEKMNKLEEKLYNHELADIHKSMEGIVNSVMDIFEKYGHKGFTADLIHHVNTFMKENFWIKYDYQIGKYKFEKERPSSMKIPDKLQDLIRDYAITNFISKVDEIHAATDDWNN